MKINELIAIVIIYVILIIFYSRILEYKQLTGFWKASNEYCKSANIDLFIFYIGPGYYNRNAYILIKNEDGVIINNLVEINLMPKIKSAIHPMINTELEYNMNIDWLDNSDIDENTFPSNQELSLYPFMNKLILSSNEKTYAILYKDNIMSDV
jgi:hypothetical protein